MREARFFGLRDNVMSSRERCEASKFNGFCAAAAAATRVLLLMDEEFSSFFHSLIHFSLVTDFYF